MLAMWIPVNSLIQDESNLHSSNTELSCVSPQTGNFSVAFSSVWDVLLKLLNPFIHFLKPSLWINYEWSLFYPSSSLSPLPHNPSLEFITASSLVSSHHRYNFLIMLIVLYFGHNDSFSDYTWFSRTKVVDLPNLCKLYLGSPYKSP